MTDATQPALFETDADHLREERIVLHALGDFQTRGKILAERELALDRLRGAFKRSVDFFETDELSDEAIVKVLERLGAIVKRVPTFVAKHPYRVTVTKELAARASEAFSRSDT